MFGQSLKLGETVGPWKGETDGDGRPSSSKVELKDVAVLKGGSQSSGRRKVRRPVKGVEPQPLSIGQISARLRRRTGENGMAGDRGAAPRMDADRRAEPVNFGGKKRFGGLRSTGKPQQGIVRQRFFLWF